MIFLILHISMVMNEEFIQRVAIPDFSANNFFFLNARPSLLYLLYFVRFESTARDEFDSFQRRFKDLKLVFMHHLKPMHQRQLQWHKQYIAALGMSLLIGQQHGCNKYRVSCISGHLDVYLTGG